ncbi:MAG: DUF4956 domain-containing protein [Gammaproteobacteria bacterium]|nr:DUF4956 domain-containing protein [Gammaproteobacteria bacterium]|tara:strand:- start:4225 stop:4851 length:627 start_codon:yes stop_codon:yes gene_type:complete
MPVLKLSAYYLIVGGIVALIAAVVPGAAGHLPFGGTDDLRSGSMELISGEAQAIAWEPVDKAVNLTIGLASVILVMLPISWVYMGVRRRKGKEQSFLLAILLLPLAVAAIVMIVQNSLALAFSLAGIVAGVRFRLTLEDTIDAIYIFVAIGVGLAAGISAVEIGLVLGVFFNYAVLAFWYLQFGEEVAGGRWFTRDWMNAGRDEDAGS